MTFRRMLTAGCMGMMLAVTATAEPAPSWPHKPVKMISPSPAGTAPDLMARIIGDKLSQIWKQPVVVENRPGAGGTIGLVALGAADDGHTFAFVPASTLTLGPYMYKTSLDVERDIAPVALVGVSPMMLAVNTESSVTTLAELVLLARNTPDGLVASVPSQFSVPHLTVELLSRAAGVPFRAIPYSGSAQSVAAVVGGDAQFTIDGIPPLTGMMKGGRLKPLATFAAERLPNRTGLATVAETFPGLVVNGWFGVVAPASTRAEVVEQVSRDLATVVEMPDVVQKLDTLGVYPHSLSPAAFGDYWRGERLRWEQVLADVGAQRAQ